MKRNPEIVTYKFKSGFDHEIELASLKSALEKSREMLIEPHRTDFYHVLWFEKGRPTHLVDFNPIPMEPQTLLFIGKGRVLMFDRIGNYDGKVLRFTDSFFCRNAEDAHFLRTTPLFNSYNQIPTVSLKPSSRWLHDIMSQIEEESALPRDSHQHGILQNLVHNFLMRAERRLDSRLTGAVQAGTDREFGQRFTELLDQDFGKSKHSSDYAAKMSVTEKRLHKATLRMFGKSPKEMIDARVILEARRLLLYGGSSVKEIAYALGFDEPTNFAKYFRKHVAQTPNKFRERYLSGNVPNVPQKG